MRALLFLAFVAAANAGTWMWLNNSIETVDTGVAFVSEMQGYTGGDLNNVGPAVFKTTDGGKTWEMARGTLLPVALVLSIAAEADNVVVSGVIGESYSDDAGERFSPARGGGVSQNIRHIGKSGTNQNMFGAAGHMGLGTRGFEGVCVSEDGGRSYERFNAQLFTDARYAAWPSKDVWYVAAGNWPQDSYPTERSTDRRPPRPRTSEYQDRNGRFPVKFAPVDPAKARADGYEAQISKTEDGGKTWTSVFGLNGTFYFNGIDCASETHCCASGEASGSKEAGARIYCTEDGGKTWTRTLFKQNSQSHGYSLLNIAFGTDTEIHAIGAELDAVAPTAWILHSADGGKTWTEDIPVSMLGCVGFDVDMLSGDLGFAALDNVVTQRGGVAKYEPDSK